MLLVLGVFRLHCELRARLLWVMAWTRAVTAGMLREGLYRFGPPFAAAQSLRQAALTIHGG